MRIQYSCVGIDLPNFLLSEVPALAGASFFIKKKKKKGVGVNGFLQSFMIVPSNKRVALLKRRKEIL